MQLESFQVIGCFGFSNSGRVKLTGDPNLIYLLGRNSSGKTSFLQAIRHFEFDRNPHDYKNFENFDTTNSEPLLRAWFYQTDSNAISFQKFREDVYELLRSSGLSRPKVFEASPVKAFLEKVDEEYRSLIKKLGKAKSVEVTKGPAGNYLFEVEGEENAESRIQVIDEASNKFFRNGKLAHENKTYTVRINANDIENLIFKQFPKIVLITDDQSLIEDIPDRLTEKHLEADNSPLLNALVEYIGSDLLNEYFLSNNPYHHNQLLERFQSKLDELTGNNSQKSGINLSNYQPIKMVIHSNMGLQITVQADGKASYYRQLSDNTKVYIAYILYMNELHASNVILLFDEPSKGLHPSSERALAEFLQSLPDDQLKVLVSTHSQYLINLDCMSGFRLMGTDDTGHISISSTPHIPSKGASDALALQPVLDAIGLKYGHSLNVESEMTLVEGISDLIYIRAWEKMLGASKTLIAPGRGEGSLMNILPFFIGQGIGVKVVLDQGIISKKIADAYPFKNEHVFTVRVPEQFRGRIRTAGIEDLFSKGDFRWILETYVSEVIDGSWENLSNSKYVKNRNLPKRLIAQYLHDDAIALDSFEEETVGNFRELFDFLSNEKWFRM